MKGVAIMILTLTLHALGRMKQRGVTKEAIIKTILYGFEKGSKDGRHIYNLTKSVVKSLFKKEKIDILKYEGMRVVIDDDNQVITAYKSIKNKKDGYHVN